MIFIAIIILFSINCKAQEDTIYLKEITIEDFTTSNFSTKVDSIKLNEKLFNNIGNLLQSEGSIIIKKYGNNQLQTISIRGTNPQHCVLLWNNIPINSNLNGQFNLSNIILLNNDNLFINYSINSKKNYFGSFGGTILLNTNIKEEDKESIELYIQYQSLNNKLLYLSNLTNFKLIKVKNSILLSHNLNEFSYNNKSILPNQIIHSKSLSKQILFNNEILIKNITISNQYNATFAEIPPLMTNIYKTQHNEWNYTKEYLSAINIKIKNNIHTTAGIKLSEYTYRLEHIQNNNIIKTIFSKSNEPTFYLSTSKNSYLEKNFWIYSRLSYTYKKGYFNDILKDINFSNEQHIVDIYQSLEKKWKKIKANVNGNILTNLNNIYFLPSISLNYKLFSIIEVTQNIGYNVRLPNLNELYYIPGGNPDLQPEKAIQTDINIKYKKEKINTTITVETSPHFSTYNNWILWMPSYAGYWEPKNIRQIIIYGNDIKITFYFSLNKHILHNSFIYSNIWANGKDGIYTFKHIPYIPKNTISYFNNYTYKKLSISNEIIFNNKRFVQTYNNYLFLNPYVLWNVYLSYNYKHIITKFAIENILNTEYQSVIWRAMPKRFYTLAFHLKF